MIQSHTQDLQTEISVQSHSHNSKITLMFSQNQLLAIKRIESYRDRRAARFILKIKTFFHLMIESVVGVITNGSWSLHQYRKFKKTRRKLMKMPVKNLRYT